MPAALLAHHERGLAGEGAIHHIVLAIIAALARQGLDLAGEGGLAGAGETEEAEYLLARRIAEPSGDVFEGGILLG